MTRLRGSTLLSTPFTLLGIIASVLGVSGLLWVFAGDSGAGAPAVWLIAVCTCIALSGFVAARGCRVDIDGGTVTDVVAWIAVSRVRCDQIERIRVRRGPWRTFEMELTDGTRRVVLGAGPLQFPAYLHPDAARHDRDAIDAMLGAVGT